MSSPPASTFTAVHLGVFDLLSTGHTAAAVANRIAADLRATELLLDAYDYATSAAGGAKGAVMLGDEMIDEASRKMALVVAAKGRAAGMARTKSFTAPSSSDSTAGA